MTTPSEQEIDRVVSAMQIELDDDLTGRLIQDVAYRIHAPETIAVRYGFGTVDNLKQYLASHPQVTKETQRLRAIVDSDGSLEARARLKAGFASENLVPQIHGIASDPTKPAGVRIDAFKQLNRMAGLDGMPASAKDGGGSGTQFNLTINMPGGRTEKIVTTVVDQPAIEVAE